MRTLRALAALLSYPTADLVEAAPEIRGAIDREALVPASERDALHRLIDDLATGDVVLAERLPLEQLSHQVIEHLESSGDPSQRALALAMRQAFKATETRKGERA